MPNSTFLWPTVVAAQHEPMVVLCGVHWCPSDGEGSGAPWSSIGGSALFLTVERDGSNISSMQGTKILEVHR
jgi:hypothetical protein